FVNLPSAQTLTVPPSVPGSAGISNVTTTQLRANWTSNGNLDGTSYTVVLSTADSPGTNGFPGNLSITTALSSATFSGLVPNTLYFADVNASNAGGNSAFTDLGSVATLANPPTPVAPTGIGTNQITARWGTNGNPAGTQYLVQASPDANFTTITSG